MSTHGTSALKTNQHFRAKDYLTWPSDERWELIKGVPYNMSPAPRRAHQKLVGMLHSDLFQFLKGHPCEVYVAPIDVYLVESNEQDISDADSVVQPDVLVVCDPRKLIDEGVRGTPDFVAEILSSSTASKDLEEKKTLYESHGVREYWVVKGDGSVFVWLLEGRRYLPAIEYLPESPVPSKVVSGFVWSARHTPST